MATLYILWSPFALAIDSSQASNSGDAAPASPSSPSSSYSNSPSSDDPMYRRFALSSQALYIQSSNLSMLSFGTSATPQNISAQFSGFQVLGGFNFRPKLGVELSFFGGVVLGGRLSASGTSSTAGTVGETLTFDNAASYGIGLKVDVFPSWRFHFIPEFRWIHSDYSGNRASLSNSATGCSYDASTNATSTCVTLGNNTGGGVVQEKFTESDFTAALTLAFDIVPDPISSPFVVHIGAEESIWVFSGTATFLPSGAAPLPESYTFSSASPETVYAGFIVHWGPVQFGADAYFLGQSTYMGSLAINF